MNVKELAKAGILALIKYTVIPVLILLLIIYYSIKYLDPLSALITIILFGSLAESLYALLITD